MHPRPRTAATWLAQRLDTLVVARLDAEGAYVADPAGPSWTVRDTAVRVVDTTGAGDTMAGALVAALAAGADAPTATAFGVSAARIALSGIGHRTLPGHPPLTAPLAGVTVTKEDCPAMQLAALASYLRSAPELNSPRRALHTADLGTRCSWARATLASALLAERFGHRARSAGDLAWTGEIPPRCDTVVGVSQSGGTAATVFALRAAREAGRHTVALTTNGASPLAGAAHRTRTVPLPPVRETIPAGGYLTLAAGVLDLCGAGGLDGFGHQVATLLTSFAEAYERAPLTWPDLAPSALSVLTLPDLRSVDVALGAAGAAVSHDVARHWGRAPFRGGEVIMDARHIKVAEPRA